jgi:hypothetical protein
LVDGVECPRGVSAVCQRCKASKTKCSLVVAFKTATVMREMGLNAEGFNQLVDASGIKEKVKLPREGERLTGEKSGKLILKLPALKKAEEKGKGKEKEVVVEEKQKKQGEEREVQEVEMAAPSPTVGSPMAISSPTFRMPEVSPEWTSPNPASVVDQADPVAEWAVQDAMEREKLRKRAEVAEENERTMRIERDRLAEMLDGKLAFLGGS